MLATAHRFAFSDPNWIFEPKWDGYRALCLIDRGEVRFMLRNQKELTKRFPELVIIHHFVKAQSAVFDGEIVALDSEGSPCFPALQNRRQDCFIVYFAFDLLTVNGNDLRDEPLIKRKSTLKRLIKKSERIRYTDHVLKDGEGLFAAVQKIGLEGYPVGKERRIVYMCLGDLKSWLKIKTSASKEEMKKKN